MQNTLHVFRSGTLQGGDQKESGDDLKQDLKVRYCKNEYTCQKAQYKKTMLSINLLVSK